MKMHFKRMIRCEKLKDTFVNWREEWGGMLSDKKTEAAVKNT